MIEWIRDSSGLGVLREDAQGGLVANDAAAPMIRDSESPRMVTTLQRLLGDAYAEAELSRLVERARRGEELELRGVDGRRVLLGQDAPRRAFAVLGSDLEASQRADRAATVSHELANALGAIAGWARLARQGERLQEALELIESSADAAWAAARTMLDEAAGKRAATETSTDLSLFVDEAARLLAPKASEKNVKVRTQIEPGLRVAGDRGHAWSIVWNLASNAVEALPEGGTVELRVSSAGDSVVLGVEDDGPGLSAEQQARAFEPYFTTKESGTGLGLPTVRRCAEEVGGRVELRSERGLGTRFTVILPRVEGQPSMRPNAKRSSGVFYAEPIDGRILVVDDDLGLREMIATALGMRGAEVVAVDTPEEALRQQGPFELAIVDLLLPGMRGDQVLADLRRAGIAQRAMLITGTELPDQLASGGQPDAVLRKPFELEDLFERLAGMLSGDDSSAATG